MIRWRRATVTGLAASWRGATVYTVVLDPDDGVEVRALAYDDVIGPIEPGEVVVVNTTALDAGLGTGGLALVVALADRVPPTAGPRSGHVVKARYTPVQTMVLGVDEQGSPHHKAIREATSVRGLVVVTADLHSALPAVICGVRSGRPDARVVYLMTDGGALPIAFSRTVAGLVDAGWIHASVTTGQSYGGDYEAVTVHSGLLAARHVAQADVVVVAQGPGNLGTDTTWGFSGVSAGEALNAADTLQASCVGAVRVSEADIRPRHRGLSHHSTTAYGRVAKVPVTLPVPDGQDPFWAGVRHQAEKLVAASQGRVGLASVDVAGLREALERSPVPLSTMGRGLRDDAASFIASAAAGRYAAGLL